MANHQAEGLHHPRPVIPTGSHIRMAEFFKTSVIWVVDFHYEGRARRWFRAFGPKDDPFQKMTDTLKDLYGDRAKLATVRKATEEEELQYLRGEEPKNSYCPTGR